MQLFHESRLTLRLALPLMIGQLSQMLLGVADTLMVGHLGVRDLAALTFANALFYVPFVFGIGLLTGISVSTSNAYGARDGSRVRGSCRHGLYLAGLLGLLIAVGAWMLSNHLEIFGQPAGVTTRSVVFFRIIMISILPGLGSIALKNHADALSRPWPPFWIFLGGVVLNVGLNWVLIYGKLGCPALGFEGAAWATLISRICILIAMAIWLLNAKGMREWMPYRWLRKPHFGDLRSVLSVGFPASIQMLCEVTAFSMAGLFMGRFGATALAAHQVAITLASTAFMIPLGLSMALTVRMGETDGAGAKQRLKAIAISGWALAIIYSLLAATIFLVFGRFLATVFIEEPEVVALAQSLLVIVGVFQLVDSFQVVSAAMLRGLRDAKVTALMGFIAYWIVGLPVSAGLAFSLHFGAVGVWWGLAVGLTAACTTLGPRLWFRIKAVTLRP